MEFSEVRRSKRPVELGSQHPSAAWRTSFGVETHLTSIYHKLGVTSRAGDTRFALDQGLA